jgi:hypothetical protein
MRQRPDTSRQAEGLSELLERLPRLPAADGGQATINGFLTHCDDSRLVLVAGHLRLTLPRAGVVEIASIESSSGPVKAPAVRITVALPVTLLDLAESTPEEIVSPAERPFAIAARPGSLDYRHPASYRAREAAFLNARGLHRHER